VLPTDSGLLADALTAAGCFTPMPCRGRHSCGKCAVYVSGRLPPPGPDEAALLARFPQPGMPGYVRRLACLARIDGETEVVVSSMGGVAIAPADLPLVTYDGDEPMSLGCAVDVGTTTVTVLLFRLGSHERLADVSELNHQAVHGADVITRIDAASRVGVDALQRLIVTQLDRMLAEALARADAPAGAVTRLTVTGNTTMLHLLTGRPVASLGVSPFTPDSLFGYETAASDLFPSLTAARLYLPPAISAFVGPDIVCGILATQPGEAGGPELLVDVGTNGEMALTVGGKRLCCSTAAGPVFEGANISAGMPALPGAIDDVWVEAGACQYSTIGGRRPRGLCGTGLIGAVDALLTLGVVDGTGAMDNTPTVIGDRVSVTQADVRQLQLAKAAVAAGIDALLHAAGLTPDGVARVHLAGGFGSYLRVEPAAGIGLIPRVLTARCQPAGNTALSGAAMLTTSGAARAAAERIARQAEEVQLSTDACFMARYIERMAFDGDDD